eukprot:764322-Hanusia_phi.AAC.1
MPARSVQQYMSRLALPRRNQAIALSVLWDIIFLAARAYPVQLLIMQTIQAVHLVHDAMWLTLRPI